MSVQDTFSYDVGKKYFPNADENVLHAWLGSDIRIIFLFTDVGSSRFRGFITFLRFVGNIFFILPLILYANVRHSQVSELPPNQY